MENNQLTQEVMKLQTIAAELQEQVKTLFARSAEDRKLLETVHSLALTLEHMDGNIRTMAVRQDNFDAKQDAICKDVEQIKDRPRDSWRTIVKSAISGVVGALVGAAMLLLINQGGK